MAEFIDQTGRKVELSGFPKRIVSTVPSLSELLFDLGLENNVVGITGYCVHPEHWLKEKQVIGGTKDLQIEKIKALKPDLIIGNKEENIKEQIEELQDSVPVWLSDIKSIEDALEMISELGKLTNTSSKAEELRQAIAKEQAELKASRPEGISVAYFIWKDPYMLASQDTFINSVLELVGFSNLILANNGRYPQLELRDLEKLHPSVMLLSSEPYAFTVSDLHNLGESFPGAILKIVDGQTFSWYGSRMLKAFRDLKKLQREINLLELRKL